MNTSKRIEQLDVNLADICGKLGQLRLHSTKDSARWTVAHDSLFLGGGAALYPPSEALVMSEQHVSSVRYALAFNFTEAFAGELSTEPTEELEHRVRAHLAYKLKLDQSTSNIRRVSVLHTLALQVELYLGVTSLRVGADFPAARETPPKLAVVLFKEIAKLSWIQAAANLELAFTGCEEFISDIVNSPQLFP